MTAVNYFQTLFEQQSQLSTDWLGPARREALNDLKTSGFPNRRDENWKYTSVYEIDNNEFALLDTDSDNSDTINEKVKEASFAELDCHEIVFVNGRFHSASINESLEGVTIKSLQDAIKEDSGLIGVYLNQFSQNGYSAFTALNTAFLQQGVVIIVPERTVIEKPIHCIYLSDKQSETKTQQLRNLIVLETQAEAKVIESYISIEDSQYFCNVVTEAKLMPGAQLQHYKLQQESNESYHVGSLHVSQDRDSTCSAYTMTLDGKLVRNDIHSELLEPNATMNMYGFYMPSGTQHFDNHTRVDHRAPHTFSNENYRGVMSDRSRAVFNGKVVVHKDAQKIEAHQNNANLLMSSDAEIDTKPELEIYADDVKCSHGATIGQLDENMLFYLRSRAIDEETAKILLTFAFADEVFAEISLTPIRKRLEEQALGRLPDADLIKEFTNNE